MNNEKPSLGKSAILITSLSAISSIFAFGSDIIIAAFFGAGAKMDAYLTAFVIPGILASALPTSLSLIFVPIFNRAKVERGEKEAWKSASYLLNFLGSLLLLSTFILAIFSKSITTIMAPGFSPGTASLCSSLFIWLLFGSTIIGMNSLLSGLHNANYHFSTPAFMPLLQNIITIIIIFSLSRFLGIHSLALSVVAGAFFQFLFLSSYLFKNGRYTFGISLKSPELKEAFKLAAFSVFGNIAYFSYSISDRYFGSFLPSGSISYLGYASKIGMFFSNLVSIGIGTVSFSKYSSELAKDNHEEFANGVFKAMSVITLGLIPILGILLAMREPLLTVVFQRKAFTHDAVVNTGWAMVYYAGLFVTMGLGRSLTYAFYAMKDTITPLIINLVSLFIYVPLTYLLCRYFLLGYVGIAIASSAINIFNFSLYWIIFIKRNRFFKTKVFLLFIFKISCIAFLGILLWHGLRMFIEAYLTSFISAFALNISLIMLGGIIWIAEMLILYLSKDKILLLTIPSIPILKRLII